MPTRKWGSEILVNTTTAGYQTTPDVAVLTDGRIVVVWEDDQADGDQTIRGTILDATGKPVDIEFDISAGSGQLGKQYSPVVTAMANGGFFVSWIDEDIQGSDNDVVGAVYGSDGGVIRYLDTATDLSNSIDPSVASFGDGTIVTWINNNGGEFETFYRITDADGQNLQTVQVSSSLDDRQFEPDVATQPGSDSAVIVWRDQTANVIKGTLQDGISVNPFKFTIDAPASNPTLYDPEVTWLGGETFVVSWRQLNSAQLGSNEIAAQIFTAVSGIATPVTGPIKVNGGIAGDQFGHAITALPNGGFAVCWTDVSETGVDAYFGIKLQVFDGAGNRVGTEIVVNTTTEAGQFNSSLSALPDGRIVVTWQDNSSTGGDTDGDAIRMQIIDPRDGSIGGSALNDTLFGHELVNDEISAGTGNDIAFGLGGNDAIYGAGGQDRLEGGKGDDILEGGNGADTLIGGTGDDVLDGGFGGDTASYADRSLAVTITLSQSGGGQAIVGQTAEDTLIAIENLTGGSGGDRLTGNASNNVLTGNAGADRLAGGGGRDTLIGGFGADRLTGDSGPDTFRFDTAPAAANVDTITDFVRTDDTIELASSAYGGIPLGVLKAGAFFLGAAAQDGSDRIIYDSATGRIFYDSDGTGTVAAVQFATVAAGTVLGSNDFVII